VPTTEQLDAWLSAIRTARFTGTLTVTFPDKSSVTYKSDAELAAAEAALVQQLAAANGTGVHTILLSSTKGLEA
jgi:hypothetical protein